MVYPLILWLVTRAVRASKEASTHHHHHHHHDDAPPLHPRIKIEVIDIINKHHNTMTSVDKAGDSNELVKRQPSDHDECDRVTVRGTHNVGYSAFFHFRLYLCINNKYYNICVVYDNGDGIPDAEAVLRSVAESLALHIPAHPFNPAKPQMASCECYIDQDTFELETTCRFLIAGDLSASDLSASNHDYECR
jgi:hypothetical protein